MRLGRAVSLALFAVVQDSVLKSVRLTHTGASRFLTLLELTAANLRSLLSAYAELCTFRALVDAPTDVRDPDVRLELRRRLTPTQLEPFAHVPAA